jgi:hypothetical protein
MPTSKSQANDMNQRSPKTKICPACGSVAVPLIFGEPTEETGRAAKRGEVILGGCCIRGDGSDPSWACKSCGLEFDSPSR